jgi:hypothetical protein
VIDEMINRADVKEEKIDFKKLVTVETKEE